MTVCNYPNTVAKRLTAGGSSWTMPTTRAGIAKRLETIAAGRGGHKPTAAHPYRTCFEGGTRCAHLSPPARYDATLRRYVASAPAMSCVEYIARSEGRRDWAEESTA